MSNNNLSQLKKLAYIYESQSLKQIEPSANSLTQTKEFFNFENNSKQKQYTKEDNVVKKSRGRPPGSQVKKVPENMSSTP